MAMRMSAGEDRNKSFSQMGPDLNATHVHALIGTTSGRDFNSCYNIYNYFIILIFLIINIYINIYYN